MWFKMPNKPGIPAVVTRSYMISTSKFKYKLNGTDGKEIKNPSDDDWISEEYVVERQ